MKLRINDHLVDFCQVSRNKYTALTDIRVATSETSATANMMFNMLARSRIDIEAEGSANKQGRVRTMVKVTLPYQAVLQPETTESSGSNAYILENDARRSGGEVTAHMVVSLPKAMVEDLRGRNGDATLLSATGQLGIVIQTMLGILSSGQGISVSYKDAGATKYAYPYADAATGALKVYKTRPQNIPTGCVPAPMLGFLPSTLAGSAGAVSLTVPDLTDKTVLKPGVSYTARLLTHPLVRAINGMDPLCNDQTYAPQTLELAD